MLAEAVTAAVKAEHVNALHTHSLLTVSKHKQLLLAEFDCSLAE
jgi:hypothetical protein